MLGGVRSIKGEKQMIYKNITFKAAPFSYDLTFDDRITLVGGDSGTGKTVLYEMLEDIRLTDEYKAIKLFNYKSDDFLEAIKQCRDSFIVIDNADCMINDDVRRFINFELSNQYMLFLRNCDGLNVSYKSFKEAKYQWELSEYLNRYICQPEGFDAYGYPSELFKLDMERLGIAAKRKPAKVIDFTKYIDTNRSNNH